MASKSHPFARPFSLVGAMASSFHPRRLPPMLRATYARELLSWLFLPVMLGAIEGGTIGIVVKKSFTGAEGVDERTLNFAVTILTAAPNFANLTSFLWAALARGRAKVPFISWLQLATAGLVAAMALVPHDLTGLLAITLLAVLARTCWTGVITLRTAVWRNNYPHANRATIAGKMAIVQSLMLAASGWVIGEAMDWNANAFHVLFPCLAAIGIVGNSIYRRVRLRGQRRLARAELAGRAGPSFTLRPLRLAAGLFRSMREVWTTLAEDRLYRAFMWWMFVFGFGNLMYAAPLALVLNDEFGVSYHQGILIHTVIPLAVMPFAIPLWARLLGRCHIIEFRALHGWTFVAATGAMWIASALHVFWLFHVAAVLLGIGFGGGILAWNLGHHDFAPAHKDGQYMAVHVTLNGIRGLLAPIASFALYEWLFARGQVPFVFLVCVLVNTVGVLGFMGLRGRLRRERAQLALPGEGVVELPRRDA